MVPTYWKLIGSLPPPQWKNEKKHKWNLQSKSRGVPVTCADKDWSGRSWNLFWRYTYTSFTYFTSPTYLACMGSFFHFIGAILILFLPHETQKMWFHGTEINIANGTGVFICLEASLSWLVGRPTKGRTRSVCSIEWYRIVWVEMISFERSLFFFFLT